MARTFFSSLTSIYGPFFNERLILYSDLLILITSFDYILARMFLGRPCLQALCIQSLTRTRMSTGLTAFTATHRMVMRVHNHTTVARTASQPARTSGLSGTLKRMVRIAHTADCGLASTKNLTSLSRRQFNHTITSLTRGQLCKVSCRANQQSPLSRTQFNVMNHRTHRDVLQRERVAHLRCRILPGHHRAAHLQAIRSNNIPFLSICVKQQSDTGRTVRIVFNGFHYSWNTVFLSLEINQTIFLFMTAAHVTHCHLAGIVTATR